MKNNNFNAAVAILFTFTLTFMSCKKEPGETLPTDPVQINMTSNQVSLIESENSFALDIFRKVMESSSESENVIISPLSISSALSMTLNGSDGATRDSMLEALRVNGLTPEMITRIKTLLKHF